MLASEFGKDSNTCSSAAGQKPILRTTTNGWDRFSACASIATGRREVRALPVARARARARAGASHLPHPRAFTQTLDEPAAPAPAPVAPAHTCAGQSHIILREDTEFLPPSALAFYYLEHGRR